MPLRELPCLSKTLRKTVAARPIGLSSRPASRPSRTTRRPVIFRSRRSGPAPMRRAAFRSGGESIISLHHEVEAASTDQAGLDECETNWEVEKGVSA